MTSLKQSIPHSPVLVPQEDPKVSAGADSEISRFADQRVCSGQSRGSRKVCGDCGRKRLLSRFPRDKYGRIDRAQCLGCIDEHTPTLMTEGELARHRGISVDQVRCNGLEPVGSYAPPRGKVIALYSRPDVDASGGAK